MAQSARTLVVQSRIGQRRLKHPLVYVILYGHFDVPRRIATYVKGPVAQSNQLGHFSPHGCLHTCIDWENSGPVSLQNAPAARDRSGNKTFS